MAYAEADLSESERLRDRGEFKASAAVLQRAKDRLREFVPPELRDRLSTAFDNLELVTRLDAIRLERALVKPPTEVLGVLVMPVTAAPGTATGRADETASGRHYEEAFREAGIGAPGDDPAEAAARVRASPVRRAPGGRAGRLGRLRRRSGPAGVGPRGGSAGRPGPLARPRPRPRDVGQRGGAPRPGRSGARGRAVASASGRARRQAAGQEFDAVPFLTRVVAAYPNDFWANIEMGNALLHQSKAAEAAAYYRAALSLRPETVSIHYALGGMYLGLHRWDQCIAEYEQAIRLDPENAWCHNRLGVALQWKGGHDDEAIAQFRKSIRIDPNIGWSHHHLAVSLERKGRFDEAVEEFREAARLLPEKRAEWKRDLRRVLMRQGRGAEAARRLEGGAGGSSDRARRLVRLRRAVPVPGGRSRIPPRPSRPAGAVRRGHGPHVAERVGRACLLLPGTEDELRQAVALTERAVDAKESQYDWIRPYFHFAKGLAHYRQGRFDDAIAIMTGDASKAAEYMGPSPRLVTAMALYQKGQKDEARKLLAAAVLSYDWSAEKATTREAWIAHILRREAEALIFRNLPASTDDK